MKIMLLVIFSLLTFNLFSGENCKKCLNKGYFEKYITCPLCKGFGTVSPAYFGKATSSMRWTETTYLLTGAKTEDNFRYKKYSFQKCPICCKSIKKGKIKTIEKCDCGKQIIGNKDNEAIKKFKKSFNTTAHEHEINEIDWTTDGFKFQKILFESKSWGITDLRKDEGIKILKEAISGNYDIESANYLRNESKSDVKDMWGERE